MKKFILLSFLTSFFLGMAQEKKISFAKEFTYRLVGNKLSNSSVKMYVSKNNEFFSNVTFKDIPMYFFTDALGTSPVSLEMNNRLSGSGVANYFFPMSYTDEPEEEYIFDYKKLNTKETVLGISCNHYLVDFKPKNQTYPHEDNFLKLCIDETSPYNSFTVFNGLVKQYLSIPKLDKYNLKGLILKLAPEKDYDIEYLVMNSLKDSKEEVYFDHKKVMTDQQRKRDSIKLAYKQQQDEYNKTDSVAMDSAVTAADSTMAFEEYSFIPDYVSEYKKNQSEDGALAIHNISNDKFWKAIPQHCKKFDQEIPTFKNKELKGHLKNYVGQMCDMYLTQFSQHTVGVKITLDEIRREALYFNEIQEKLDAADRKKLNNYLKNLD